MKRAALPFASAGVFQIKKNTKAKPATSFNVMDSK